jgi:hypothetical protein
MNFNLIIKISQEEKKKKQRLKMNRTLIILVNSIYKT